MCGAGVLPARMAAQARRQGWRVVAFPFGDAPGLDAVADRTVPSRLSDLGPVLGTLAAEGVEAALFSGKFWLGDVLRQRAADEVGHALAARAGSLGERPLAETVVSTLARLGVEVLDQRAFLGDWIQGAGCSTAREPSDVEWADLRRGLVVARRCAALGVGQTVVLKQGVVAAVEALEGTTEAVRRGAALAGPGTVVMKAVAPDNDYRFDTPAIGPDTVRAAAAGGVAVIGVEAGRVLLLEREAIVEAANRSGIALVAVDDERDAA
jgi:UDP-2,3-diacylglucosamine hydrolase